jgi:polar amino acid transport system substrate-binding protein
MLSAVAISTTSGGATQPVATVSSSELVSPGNLQVCVDAPAPPWEFYSTNGKLEGIDIQMGDEIGQLLGLKTVWVQSVFDTIIEAVDAGKCDVIISSMSVTPQREKLITQIPYFVDGEGFLVAKGNPDHIKDPTGLGFCGETVAAEIGSVDLPLLAATSVRCKKAGLSPVHVTDTTNNSTSEELVATGHAAVFQNGHSLVEYVAKTSPSGFQVLNGIEDQGPYGIGIPFKKPSIKAGVLAALKAMEKDGAFQKILTQWGQPTTNIPNP